MKYQNDITILEVNILLYYAVKYLLYIYKHFNIKLCNNLYSQIWLNSLFVNILGEPNILLLLGGKGHVQTLIARRFLRLEKARK